MPQYATVLRRIGSWQYDHRSGKIQSSAFANDGKDEGPPDSHSVNWKERSAIINVMAGHWGKFGLAAVAVKSYLVESQTVEHSPKPGNYGHCDAIGEKTKGRRRHLRDSARILIPPPPGSTEDYQRLLGITTPDPDS